jgi:hypothetical protein
MFARLSSFWEHSPLLSVVRGPIGSCRINGDRTTTDETLDVQSDQEMSLYVLERFPKVFVAGSVSSRPFRALPRPASGRR